MLTAHRPRLRCSRLFAAPAVYSSRRWHDREHFLANRELRGGLASARRQTAAMQGHRKAWWNGKRQGRARGSRSRTRLRPARRRRGARQRVAGIKACALPWRFIAALALRSWLRPCLARLPRPHPVIPKASLVGGATVDDDVCDSPWGMWPSTWRWSESPLSSKSQPGGDSGLSSSTR